MFDQDDLNNLPAPSGAGAFPLVFIIAVIAFLLAYCGELHFD